MRTQFSWDCPSTSFTISPQSGVLPPKGSLQLKATFHPESASVYNISATCTFGKEEERKIHLKGVGKYPHLVVRFPYKGKGSKQLSKVGGGRGRESGTGSGEYGTEVVVGFGSVAVGTSVEKRIELVNVSAVSGELWGEGGREGGREEGREGGRGTGKEGGRGEREGGWEGGREGKREFVCSYHFLFSLTHIHMYM